MFRRIISTFILPILFFGLAFFDAVQVILHRNNAFASPGHAVSTSIGILGVLICLSVSYALWKTKRWGWWTGAVYSVIGLGMTLVGVAWRIYIQSVLLPSIKPTTPRVPAVFGWEIIWVFIFISLLVLLFLPTETNRHEGLTERKRRNALILGGVGLAVPVLINAAIFLATPLFMRMAEVRRPPQEGLFGKGIDHPSSMLLSPDGRTLAVDDLSKDNTLTFLDISTDRIKRCQLPARPFQFCWSMDSQMVAVYCGSDAGILVIDANQARVIQILKRCGHRLAFHPDGSLWNLDYQDNTLWRFDTKTWAARSLIEPCCPVLDFAISPDGKSILLAWGDYSQMTPRVLNPETGELLEKWSDGKDPYIRGIRFSHDGLRVFTTHGFPNKRGSLKVWNAKTGKVEYEISDLSSHQCDFEHIDVSRDDAFLSARNIEDQLGVWSIQDHRWIWEAPGPPLNLALTPAIFGTESKEIWTGLGLGFDSFRDREKGLKKWDLRKPTN